MADTTVDAGGVVGSANRRGLWGPYWTTPLIGVIVGIETGTDIATYRTTDGGINWATDELQAGTCVQMACWFDRQTPGDSGNLVHIVWLDSADGDFTYANIDVSTGTQSTPVDIDGSASINATAQNNFCYVGKSRNGRLYAGSVNAATGSGAYESDDAGATWGASDSPWETNALDEPKFFPANTGDGKDYGLLFGDVSAGEVTAKMYDESAGTFTETAVTSSITFDVATDRMMSLSTRLSDGHIIAVVLTAVNNAGADVQVFDINPTTISSVSVTALTNAWTDIDNAGSPSIFIDQASSDLYASLMIGATQDFAAGGADCSLWFKKSTDDGATWGSAAQYSEGTADDFRPQSIAHAMASSLSGGRFQPAFTDADDAGTFVNLVNDVGISAVTIVIPMLINKFIQRFAVR